MEEGTKKALMIGVPIVIGGAALAIYFATRKPEDGLPPGCMNGDILVDICPDGTQIVSHTCQGGQWIPTGEACPTQPPEEDIIQRGTVNYIELVESRYNPGYYHVNMYSQIERKDRSTDPKPCSNLPDYLLILHNYGHLNAVQYENGMKQYSMLCAS